jgi:hypothetical protein
MDFLKNSNNNFMIIAITDGKGMTDKVSTLLQENKIEKARQLYGKFFRIHVDILKNSRLGWTITKTTGDGLFFYINSKDYFGCLKVLIKLYKALNKIKIEDKFIGARLFFFYCDNKDIIRGNLHKTFCPSVRKFTYNDLFGHQLNYGFRLLSLASGKVIFTEQNFVSKLFPKIKDINYSSALEIKGIQFSKRIPITYLKGINECGFSYNKKTPKWIFEVNANN